jgi:hypothetical protein
MSVYFFRNRNKTEEKLFSFFNYYSLMHVVFDFDFIYLFFHVFMIHQYFGASPLR